MTDDITITLAIDDAQDLYAALLERPHDEAWSDRVLTSLALTPRFEPEPTLKVVQP